MNDLVTAHQHHPAPLAAPGSISAEARRDRVGYKTTAGPTGSGRSWPSGWPSP